MSLVEILCSLVLVNDINIRMDALSIAFYRHLHFNIII